MPDDSASRPLRAHQDAVELGEAWRRHSAEAARSGASGLKLALEQSDITDRALASIFEEAIARRDRTPEVALIALGGYGRRELCPLSDIDVVLAYDGRVKGIAEIAEAVWYPLWDAGFKVGHAVRSIREAAAAVAGNIEMMTSHLDARLVAGSTFVFDRLSSKVDAIARKRSAWVAEALASSRRTRLSKPGREWGALEPDLKQGAGGLRDVQTIRWIARSLGDPRSAHELLAPFEAAAVERSAETLVRVRFALHALLDRADDTLSLDRQVEVARALGLPVDEMLRELHTDMLAASSACDAALAATSVSSSGTVDVSRAVDRAAVLQAIADSARAGGRPIKSSARQLMHEWAREEPAGGAWTDGERSNLAATLASGAPAAGVLRSLAAIGVLGALMPELGHMAGRTQHNPYHRLTVDAHTFAAVAAAAEGDPEGGPPDVAADVRAELGEDLVTYLGILFHDAAKGMPGDHAEVGAELVEQAATRIGIDPEGVRRAARIVGDHLLLADFATRRDIADPAVIDEVAARVVDVETLRSLYLLTVADSRTTGPSAWSAWKSGLVRALFLAVLTRLSGEGDDETAGSGERPDRLAMQVGAQVVPHLRRLLDEAPASFLRTADDDTLTDCARLMASGEGIATSHRHIARGVHALTVVAADRPSLLNRLAGALALNSMSILGADLMTLTDGTAVDVLTVSHEFEEHPPEQRWQRLEADILDSISGRLAIAHRLRRRSRSRRGPGPKATPARIVIDNSASADSTVIEIHARDREGFLYLATRELADLALDIRLARIATMGHDVVDVFYVRGPDGGKVVDERHLAEVRDALSDLAEHDPW